MIHWMREEMSLSGKEKANNMAEKYQQIQKQIKKKVIEAKEKW